MAVRGTPAWRRVGRASLMLAWLAGFALIAVPGSKADRAISDDPVGVHSMLYLDTPFGAKEAMFREAESIGASTIRLDISLSGVFQDPDGTPDWTDVDQYVLLARRYHLHVLADLLATPWYLVDCPAGAPLDITYRCPPRDPSRWGLYAGEIAAHTKGVIDYFEIINEPDGNWAFLGTPRQYAAILSASYDAIHRANPHAEVAMGGLMHLGASGREWMNAVLAAPGKNASRKFDIVNVHIRTPASDVAAVVCGWRRYFLEKAVMDPLWVTETGYPADPAEQTDPKYQGGASAQARYLASALPAMLGAGAANVFVTERDAVGGRYASEGVLDTADPLTDSPVYTRRPSFYVVRHLADGAWRSDSRDASRCPINWHLRPAASPARSRQL